MKIIGTGSALPAMTVSNDMLSSFLDTNDDWISTRTGIKTRRIISDESLTDLAIRAAQHAVDNSGIKADQLDYIICSNVANNYVTPAMSCIVQGAIDATCPCLDLNGACAGFIYALDIAESFLKTERAKNILIVCAEEPTKFCNWKQRETSVLFGDGAGAVVITGGNALQAIRLTTQSKKDVLYYRRKLESTPFDEGTENNDPLVMVGRDVFRMAVSCSCADVSWVLDQAHLTSDSVDFFLLHQANFRIIDSIRTHLKQPEEKFPSNLERYGNTSSASIPILIDELAHNGKLTPGTQIVMSAFGAGFVTGACALRWE